MLNDKSKYPEVFLLCYFFFRRRTNGTSRDIDIERRGERER